MKPATVTPKRGARAARSVVATPPAKLDLSKLFKAEYVAPRKPVLLQTKPARYLAIEDQGAPGGPAFQACIGALYAMAFTVKMTRKFSGQQDYTVGKLEGRYLNLDRCPLPPKAEWRWQLLIRTPEFVAEQELARAIEVLRKRGKQGEAARVRLVTIDEGRCVQMLHVGPYDQEVKSVGVMQEFAASKGLSLCGAHHEIYLSDPRRVPPEKLKTILRLPVSSTPE